MSVTYRIHFRYSRNQLFVKGPLVLEKKYVKLFISFAILFVADGHPRFLRFFEKVNFPNLQLLSI